MFAENSHVIGQKELEQFRKEMAERSKDPRTVILKRSKLPLTLLSERFPNSRPDFLSAEPFEDTFGQQARRKKPKFAHADLQAMASYAAAQQGLSFMFLFHLSLSVLRFFRRSCLSSSSSFT